MAAKPTTDLVAYFTANPSFFSGAPDVAMTETSSSFVRSEIIKASDPYITYATITYKEGTREDALGGWKTVTSETQKNEPETLSYGIAKDKGSELVIKTLEVYANEKYFREVHAPSKAVAENKAKYGDQVRTSIKFAFLKFIGGYLHKEPSSPNL
jgi:quinol monooxygenase YgiN